jgi:hypothetical protein
MACTNILIKDVVMDKNYRQGISIISAENLLIENCVFANTAGTLPEAGIDFEPNWSSEKLVNCRVINCLSIDNNGQGYVVYMTIEHPLATDLSITFESCFSRGNKDGVGVSGANDGGPGGQISFIGGAFVEDRRSEIMLTNKSADGPNVLLSNNILRSSSTSTAIWLLSNDGNTTTRMGGVDVQNLIGGSTAGSAAFIRLQDETGNGVRSVRLQGMVYKNPGAAVNLGPLQTDIQNNIQLIQSKPPAVDLQMPSTGTITAGQATAVALAFDPDSGTGNGAGIQKVVFELRRGTTTVSSHQVNSAPYQRNYSFTGMEQGIYMVWAKAYSPDGGVSVDASPVIYLPQSIQPSRPRNLKIKN